MVCALTTGGCRDLADICTGCKRFNTVKDLLRVQVTECSKGFQDYNSTINDNEVVGLYLYREKV